MVGGRGLKGAKQQGNVCVCGGVGGGKKIEEWGGEKASTFSNQYPFPRAVMLLREWLLHYQTESF